MSENIMIIGASILQVPLIREAKNKGFNTVVVSPNKLEPGFKYADIPVYKDVKDKSGILQSAKKYTISGITTDQTDNSVRTVAYVAEKMGLPGIGIEKSELFTDKYLMREECKRLGIKTLNYKKVNNIDDAIAFFKKTEKGIIIKPIDSQGSQGVYHITNINKLIDKFEDTLTYSNTNEVLIEEYIHGKEFVIEGLVVDGIYQHLVIGEPCYFNIPDVFSSASITFPPKKPSPLIEQAKDLNREIIEGFELKQGRTHSEFIIDGNDIYLIETAARGGGVFISSDIVNISTGINNEDILIKLATKQLKTLPAISDRENVSCYIAFYLPEGEIKTLNGINEVNELSFVHNHNLNSLHIGMQTVPYTDKRARFFLVLSAKDQWELQKNIKTIRNTLDIQIQVNKDLIGPIWG